MVHLGKKETQFYLFAGKGGVGKTSIAAATALYFAGKKKKTLIISTDPAHSLTDSFEKKIGGDIVDVSRNLSAVEIDPKKAMEEYKQKIAPKMDKLDFLKGLDLGDAFDFAGNTPGIDELAAFDKFMQYMQSKEYDVIVFDTAPFGHTLRFLSLPDLLDSWVGKMINIRLKLSGMMNMFKKFVPFGDAGDDSKLGTEQLELVKTRIAEARKILGDKKRTRFNLVLIPEAMSIYESERSVKTLAEYGIPVNSIYVNQLIPENTKCAFCSERRKMQQERLKEIRSKFKGLSVAQVPLYNREVKGMSMLATVGKELYSKQ
ncbi:MAG: TRC40/GET3/ArsA family transport-energizing ATPase [Candidatus Aenigmatarchaeota archaeon]